MRDDGPSDSDVNAGDSARLVGETIQSAALAASDAVRAAKLADLSNRRAARALIVPASENAIRAGLRSFGQPICLFGEDLHDRRERLRAAMAAGDLESRGASRILQCRTGDVEASATGTVAPRDLASSNKDDEEYYTEGTEELRAVRLALAKPTLSHALDRLVSERKLRESDESHDVAKIDFQEAEAKTVECIRHTTIVLSQVGDVRPLSSISIGSDPRASSTDVHIVATGSWAGLVKIWSCDAQGRLLQTIEGHTARVSTVHFPLEHAGTLLTSSADMTAKLYRTRDSAHISSRNEGNNGECDMFAHVATYTGHSHRISHCMLHAFRQSLVLTTSFDGTFILHEDGRKLLVQETGHKGVYSAAFHPDGSLLGTCGLEGGLRLWDMRSGRAVMTMENAHVGTATCVDFSGDGRVMASGGADNTVKIWDLRAKRMSYLIPAHLGLVSGAKFAGGGGDVLVTSSFDRTVKVWSARRGWALLKSHSEHDDKVTCVTCTPDARCMASACYDKTWKLWGYC
jgi:U4/U6 small nuclear ribonucleoprotein PRP4